MNREQANRLAPFFDAMAPADPNLYVPRPDPPITALRKAWAFGPAHAQHCLLVGALGSGKSTELAQLAREIAQQPDPPLVSLLGLQRQLDPGQITAAQVLFLLGVASLALAPTRAPADITRDLATAYTDIVEGSGSSKPDVGELVARVAVLAGGLANASGHPFVSALAAGVGGLAKGVKPPRLPLPGRGLRLSANQTPVTNLAEAVAEAMTWTRTQYANTPLAFFVDGLDKLDPGSVDEIFGAGVLSLSPCPVVYAAPLALRYTIKSMGLEPHYSFLTVHNFQVFDELHHDRRNPGGVRAMRELVGKRLEAAQLDASTIFADGLCEHGLVDDAIEMSGGVSQTLLGLLDSALRSAVIQMQSSSSEALIDRPILDAAIESARKALALRVRPSQLDILRRVRDTAQRPEGDTADELLYYNVVLAYPNDPAWFRPSPLLRRYLSSTEVGTEVGS